MFGVWKKSRDSSNSSADQGREVVIVSGLPRTGTSMMMRILHTGGMDVLIDHQREADDDNPNGYYEFEQVKKIKEDSSWLDTAQGKVVKMVSMLLFDLPANYHYKIVFMQRHIDEILRSQAKMLRRMSKPADTVPGDQMATMFGKHLDEVQVWLGKQPNMDVHFVRYNDVIKEPGRIVGPINKFLGGYLDESKMAGVVDTNLYRNRT